MNEWVRRRTRAAQNDADPLLSPRGSRSTELPGGYGLDGSANSDLDEDDEALELAIEKSLEEQQLGVRRSPTGTDVDELARVLERSKLEK